MLILDLASHDVNLSPLDIKSYRVPLSKSVSDSAIQFPQIRFCAVLPEAKQTFVSGCATLCWGVLNSLSPKCRQNNDLLNGDEMVDVIEREIMFRLVFQKE